MAVSGALGNDHAVVTQTVDAVVGSIDGGACRRHSNASDASRWHGSVFDDVG